jgi:hypothetical protein
MEDAPIHNQRADEWMKTVLLVAKGNEYSGEDVGDFTECSQLVFVYKFKVDEAIRMRLSGCLTARSCGCTSGGPRVSWIMVSWTMATFLMGTATAMANGLSRSQASPATWQTAKPKIGRARVLRFSLERHTLAPWATRSLPSILTLSGLSAKRTSLRRQLQLAELFGSKVGNAARWTSSGRLDAVLSAVRRGTWSKTALRKSSSLTWKNSASVLTCRIFLE